MTSTSTSGPGFAPRAQPPPAEMAGIARAATIIAVGNVASRLLGLVRDTTKSYYFGATGLVSAFNIAAKVPMWFYDLLAGGMVSSVRGIGDDSGQFQMDAAVQPGNSGGPIYDARGNIVGVVVAQLSKLEVSKRLGSLPENVNFGIKASTVRQFLTTNGLPSKWSTRSKKMSTKELAQIAQKQTLMVVCHR